MSQISSTVAIWFGLEEDQQMTDEDTRIAEITDAFGEAGALLDDDYDAAVVAAYEAFKLAAEYGWYFADDDEWEGIVSQATAEEIIEHGLKRALERTCPYFLNGMEVPS